MGHQQKEKKGGASTVFGSSVFGSSVFGSSVFASTVFLLILTGCTAGFEQATPNSATCESPSLGIVWVTGGPIAGREISEHGERLAVELANGGSVRVLRLDQRVAASGENIDLPGLNRCGELPDDVGNPTARQALADDLRPGIEEALSVAAANSTLLEEGRDILGGVRRMGQHDPERLELWCSDGCIHRTTQLDLFNTALPLDDPLDLDVGPQTSVRILGAGRIPVEDGYQPPLQLTEDIVAEWERACEPLADCEVRPL